MELDLYIKGALAGLSPDAFSAEQLLAQFEQRGLTPHDAVQALDKALLEGWIERADGGLKKLPRAHLEAVPGKLAEP